MQAGVVADRQAVALIDETAKGIHARLADALGAGPDAHAPDGAS